MASANVQRTIQRLDPTTLVTKPIVRFPSPNGKKIQGAGRFPNSRAALTYREQESARRKKALQHLTHGKNIFVYNHLRTNQVIYSLSRSLVVGDLCLTTFQKYIGTEAKKQTDVNIFSK